MSDRVRYGDEPPRLHGCLGKIAASNEVQGREGLREG